VPSVQKPISSGFDRNTTAQVALGGTDLAGRLAIVTGGMAGSVWRPSEFCRRRVRPLWCLRGNLAKAKTALHSLPRVEVHPMDLADPKSIDAFAREFMASDRALDLLIANAGIMAVPRSHNARGHELQFATNHLGHFQLTAQLWPSLRRSGNARVVSLSSSGHRLSDIDFEDPNYHSRSYDKWKAYGQSKTASALFALGLDTRGEAHSVRAFSVHPGTITTELQRHLSLEDRQASATSTATYLHTSLRSTRPSSRGQLQPFGAPPILNSREWEASTARIATSRYRFQPIVRDWMVACRGRLIRAALFGCGN
jgi:NAD(P)-dependent dehydrogenase (short-subunit alcohol dehydrogenase family)